MNDEPLAIWTVRTENKYGTVTGLFRSLEGAEREALDFIAQENERWSHGLDLSKDLYDLIDELQEASGWSVDVVVDQNLVYP